MAYITLANGVKMPRLGFGVALIDPAATERCVLDAIDCGYRSIDTAELYHNEDGVGRAVARAIAMGKVTREDLFITTKVWTTNAGFKRAKAAIEQSLARLQTDYADLILIHEPGRDDEGTWRALELAYLTGKARAIGVSSFYAGRFINLCHHCTIRPMVNQLETHLFCQQTAIRPLLEQHGCALESWSPFAEGKNNFFHQPLLREIGARHGKTAAQTALRFLLQSGIIGIPKTVHKARMAENFAVFDFTLTAEEMAQLQRLDTGRSLFTELQADGTLAWF